MMPSTPDLKVGKGSRTRGETPQSTLLTQSCRYLRSSEMKMTLPNSTVNGIGELGTNIPRKQTIHPRNIILVLTCYDERGKRSWWHCIGFCVLDTAYVRKTSSIDRRGSRWTKSTEYSRALQQMTTELAEVSSLRQGIRVYLSGNWAVSRRETRITSVVADGINKSIFILLMCMFVV
jgi:hypothetical protein